jgi:hypothetical protein
MLVTRPKKNFESPEKNLWLKTISGCIKNMRNQHCCKHAVQIILFALPCQQWYSPVVSNHRILLVISCLNSISHVDTCGLSNSYVKYKFLLTQLLYKYTHLIVIV